MSYSSLGPRLQKRSLVTCTTNACAWHCKAWPNQIAPFTWTPTHSQNGVVFWTTTKETLTVRTVVTIEGCRTLYCGKWVCYWAKTAAVFVQCMIFDMWYCTNIYCLLDTDGSSFWPIADNSYSLTTIQCPASFDGDYSSCSKSFFCCCSKHNSILWMRGCSSEWSNLIGPCYLQCLVQALVVCVTRLLFWSLGLRLEI